MVAPPILTLANLRMGNFVFLLCSAQNGSQRARMSWIFPGDGETKEKDETNEKKKKPIS